MKKLSDWGERKLIELLSQELDIGDDAAWFPWGKNSFLLFSTDMIYEKTHRLPGMTFQQFGKLVVTVNLSDIAAMGGRPLAFLLSYGSPDNEMENFREIISGVKKQCEKFQLKFAGGDTNEIPGGEGVVLSGSILGFMKGAPLLRSTAQVGDLVGITGKLGVGFAINSLLKGKKILPGYKKMVNKALEPKPRVKEGLLLRKYVNSLTDVSDSLAVSLHYLARQSGIGIEINLAKLPLFCQKPSFVSSALYEGGDYELLFTFPQKNLQQLERTARFSLIGQIVKEKKVVGIKEGKEIKIKDIGYEHFSK